MDSTKICLQEVVAQAARQAAAQEAAAHAERERKEKRAARRQDKKADKKPARQRAEPIRTKAERSGDKTMFVSENAMGRDPSLAAGRNPRLVQGLSNLALGRDKSLAKGEFFIHFYIKILTYSTIFVQLLSY